MSLMLRKSTNHRPYTAHEVVDAIVGVEPFGGVS